MSNDLETIGRVAIGLVPAVVALVGYMRGPSQLRATLRHDVEMLEKLPTGSAPHKLLLSSIERQLKRIDLLDTEASRDVQGAVISALMIIGLGYLALWLIGNGEWWGIGLATVTGILVGAGIGSMFDDLQRVPRDEKGKRK